MQQEGGEAMTKMGEETGLAAAAAAVGESAAAAACGGPAAGGGELRWEVKDAWAEVGASQAEWDALAAGMGGSVYMSYDWCRVWWRHYGGGRRRLRVFTFREADGRLVGVLPMFVERLWLGPTWVVVGKMVGSDSALTLCTPVVMAEHAARAFGVVMEELTGREGCDLVSFGPMLEAYAGLGALREAAGGAGARGGYALVRDEQAGVHTRFTVPETTEAYLGSLSKKKRAHLRRQMREFEKAHRVGVEVVRDAGEMWREFGRFREMHARQWRAQGKLGHFEDWPGSVAFNEELIATQGALGRLATVRITADGEPVAYFYGYEFGWRYFWRLAARELGEKWDEYGLGTIGIYEKMKMGIADGMREIEAGIGHYDYKLQWGGEERALRKVVVGSRGRWSRLRVGAFLRMAELLHLAYYRVWYLRVAPKLPAGMRRPLWRLWIRTRV